jgi:hypothetical protein
MKKPLTKTHPSTEQPFNRDLLVDEKLQQRLTHPWTDTLNVPEKQMFFLM